MSLLFNFRKPLSGYVDPTSFENLQLWLDLNDADTRTLNSTTLVGWTDKSAMGNDATSALSTGFTFTADAGDGLPELTGSNKYIDTTNDISSVSEETIFMVIRIDDVTAANRFFLESTSAGGSSVYRAGHSNSTTTPNVIWSTTGTVKGVSALRDFKDVNAGAVNGKYKILRMRRSQALNFIEMYENGFLMGRDLHSSGTTDIKYRIGNLGSLGCDISLREVIIYNAALTDAQCATIEDSLNNKWGVFSLPAAFANDNDFVKRAALAKSYASASDFTATVTFRREIGDSTTTGFALKASADPDGFASNANYVKAFTDAYIGTLTATPTSASAWVALNSTGTASATDLGRVDTEMGMAAVTSYTNASNNLLDDYVLKLGISGSKAAVAWLVDSAKYPSGTSAQDIQQYNQEALGELVFDDDNYVIDYGTVISLGPNDMDVPSEYNAYATNYASLVDFCYNILQGGAGKVYGCQVWSSASGRNDGGAAAPNQIVRTAITDITTARSFCETTTKPDGDSDTIDNTHNNGACYTAQGIQLSGFMRA